MEQRMEFALKALKSENFRALCQEYGISTKTGYKWRERFLRQGLEGLAEESLKVRLKKPVNLGLCPKPRFGGNSKSWRLCTAPALN